MKQFGILLNKDLLELYRTKKVLIILSIFAIMALLSPVLTYMTPELLSALGDEFQITLPEMTIIDSYLQLASNINQICMLVLVMCFRWINS